MIHASDNASPRPGGAFVVGGDYGNALGRRIMAVGAEERKAAIRAAQERGRETRHSGLPSAEGSPATKEEIRQRSGVYIAARGVGISEATYARANALVSAAEDPEDPAHETAVASLAEAASPAWPRMTQR